MGKEAGAQNKQDTTQNREFVDLNDNRVKLDGIYEVDTKLFGTAKRVQVVDAEDKVTT